MSDSYNEREPPAELENCLEALRDHKPCIAKVNWGTGKGPYIFAFESSVDADYCECNAHGFKKMDPKEVLKTHKKIPIYECGVKTPEEVNKLKMIDVQKYIDKNTKGGKKK